jgi:O-antigen ligase
MISKKGLVMQKIELKKIISYILVGVFLILFSCYCISLYIPQNYLIYIIGFTLSIILFIISIYSLEISFLVFIFIVPLVAPIYQSLSSTDFHFHFFLFLGFFLGGLINIIKRKKSLLDLNLRIYSPAVIFIILSFISLVFTLLRLKFIPFIASGISDFNVNILAVGNLQAIKYANYLFLFYISGFLLFFITSSIEINGRFLKFFFIFLSASFLITFFYGLYQILINPSLYNDPVFVRRGQINSTLESPSTYGMYLSILIPAFIGFGYYLYKRKKILGFYSFILSLLALVMLFYSGARASFLGLVVIIIFYFFYFGFILIRRIFKRFNMRKLLLNLISCFIILAIVSSFLFGLFFIIKNMDTNENYPGIFARLKKNIDSFEENGFYSSIYLIDPVRAVIYKQGINMFLDNPVSGIGIGQFYIELPKYNLEEYGNARKAMDHPLSLYLQILSEMGIIPLLIILWFFVEVVIFSIIFYRKIENKGFRFLFLNLLLSFVVLLVNYSLSGNINLFPPMLIFFALIGILVNFSINYKKKDYEPIYLNEK